MESLSRLLHSIDGAFPDIALLAPNVNAKQKKKKKAAWINECPANGFNPVLGLALLLTQGCQTYNPQLSTR